MALSEKCGVEREMTHIVSGWRAAFAAIAFAIAPACAPAAPAAGPDEGIHPALFVARDQDSTLYLFGTVHVRRPGTPWGGANAQAALQSADEVWTELEISPEADAQAQAMMMQLGAAPPDRPLSSWLSEAEYKRFSDLTQRLGAPAASFERMQPWLAALTLSVLPMMRAGYDPQSGVDRAIDASADAAGKNRRAFETMQQQLGFLADLSPEMQREMLLDAINESEEGPSELNDLTNAWERGDTGRLQRFVVDDMRRQYPELYQTLFVRRNRAWVETLMREMDGAGVDFVAVGAGHLVGSDGLVEQLRRRGVRVERVRDEPIRPAG
jgi:uncharacterized protein YbaP (TraB family)